VGLSGRRVVRQPFGHDQSRYGVETRIVSAKRPTVVVPHYSDCLPRSGQTPHPSPRAKIIQWSSIRSAPKHSRRAREPILISFHAVKLKFTERPIKSVTENEAEPL
jgi:hypothetical protein